MISLFPYLHLPVPNKPYGFCGGKAPRKKSAGLTHSLPLGIAGWYLQRCFQFAFILCNFLLQFQLTSNSSVQQSSQKQHFGQLNPFSGLFLAGINTKVTNLIMGSERVENALWRTFHESNNCVNREMQNTESLLSMNNIEICLFCVWCW